MNPSFPVAFLFAAAFATGDESASLPREVKVADGYSVSLAVPAALVERPVEACFDDKGRLYVTEVTGTNDKPEEQLKKAPHRVLRLEDTNGDGVFDRRTVFADKLGFPEGVLWHQGVVYVSAVPQIWKFTDTNDDGVADTRGVWFDGKTITGCANDLHGPYAGPDGLLYWCKGAFAEQTHDLPGKKGWKSRAAHVFRMKPDGTEFDCVFTAGMDNPVGLAWLPEGDLIVNGTFFQHPGDGRRDGLIHAVRGGVWGKDHNVLDGHLRTGPLMPAMTHLGPAAPCGMCRYGRDLLVCQFNMRKVSRHAVEPLGSTWQTKDSDFLTCEHPDFHPTDVLQASDGSVLVVDTGGWYKICCPTSQVSRPEATGAIYRVRKTGGEIPAACPAPRWKLEKPDSVSSLKSQLESKNLHIRRMALEELGKMRAARTDFGSRNPTLAVNMMVAANFTGVDRFMEHALTYALLDAEAAKEMAPVSVASLSPVMQRVALYVLAQTTPDKADPQHVVKHLASPDAGVREAAVFGVGRVPAWRDAAGAWLKEQLAGTGDPARLRDAVRTVAAEGALRADLGAWLASAKPGAMQHMLLGVMVELAAAREMPREWAGPLAEVLETNDAVTAPLAAAVLAARPFKMTEGLRGRLDGMAHDAQRSPAVRVPLMLALSPWTPGEQDFTLLLNSLNDRAGASGLSETAVHVISKATLTPAQLATLTAALPEANLLHRPRLLRAFSKAADESLGLNLVDRLEKCGALATLSAQDQQECLGSFPDKVQQRLAAARAKLNQGAAQQQARLDELEKSLPAGEALRGKVIFQSAKASCVLCHQAGYFGKPVGPDLSKIGSIRTRRDLLEAIAFPSASFVRSYEPLEVKRKDGTLAYGMIKNQNAQSITLVTGAVTPEVTVPMADVAAMSAGAASLMPQGIDLILTSQELADLVAFLQSLR